jgi:thioredoxin-dependent peroxiredoxin
MPSHPANLVARRSPRQQSMNAPPTSAATTNGTSCCGIRAEAGISDRSTRLLFWEARILRNRSVRRAARDPDTHQEATMAIRLGDEAPNFTAETTEGTINFYDYLGDSWGVLFSHPKDYTPVCTTELGRVAALKPEFDKRNVKVVGLSVDPLDSHEGWASDIEETQGHKLNFPLIADSDHKVSDLYDMIHPNANDTLTVRSVFIVGPDKKVKLIITYPASTGRNFDEILRVIDSLQLTANYSVATPVDWKDGEDVIITAAVSNEDAEKKFPKGFKTIKPYLRVTPQPNK